EIEFGAVRQCDGGHRFAGRRLSLLDQRAQAVRRASTRGPFPRRSLVEHRRIEQRFGAIARKTPKNGLGLRDRARLPECLIFGKCEDRGGGLHADAPSTASMCRLARTNFLILRSRVTCALQRRGGSSRPGAPIDSGASGALSSSHVPAPFGKVDRARRPKIRMRDYTVIPPPFTDRGSGT